MTNKQRRELLNRLSKIAQQNSIIRSYAINAQIDKRAIDGPAREAIYKANAQIMNDLTDLMKDIGAGLTNPFI